MFKQFSKKEDTECFINKSLWFFLPLLGEKYYEMYNIKGVFLKHFEKEEEDDCFYLVLYNSDYKNFKIYLNKLLNLSIYKTHKILPNKDILVEFYVPKSILEDYEKFKNSKYSKISNEYKNKIINFFDIKANNIFDDWRHLHYVLYKNKQLKKSMERHLLVKIPDENELSSVLNMEKETYKPELYEKHSI